MPEVNLFVPCEKVLIDPATNRWSVVSVLDSIQPIATRTPTPDNPPEIGEAQYLLPPFQVATQWGRSEREDIEEFEQCLFLEAPDGRITPVGEPLSFSLDRPVHRILQQAHVTCRLTGVYILMLKLRLAGNVDEWHDRARFPIVIEDVVPALLMFPDAETLMQDATSQTE